MADINQYEGNAAIGYGQNTGGGLLGVSQNKATLDAMDRFAMYQFYTKRDLWNRANQEKDQKAQEMAANFTFKYGDMLPKDREVVNTRIQEYFDYFRKNPNAATLKYNPDGTSNAEQYGEFQNRRNNILADIVRANVRKGQVAHLDKQISDLQDPRKRSAAEAYRQQQIDKGIADDIQLFPDIAVMDPNKMVAEFAGPPIKFDELKIDPNRDIITSFALTDVPGALGRFNNAYSFNTNGLADDMDAMTDEYNRILERNREDGKLNIDKLKKDPSKMGQAILEMLEASNRYIDYYNSDPVQGQVKSGKVEKILLDDNIDPQEMFKLMLSSKLTKNSDLKVQQTDNEIQKGQLGLQWANLAQRKAEMAEDVKRFKESKKAEFSGGDIGNLTWYNLAETSRTLGPNGQLLQGLGLENAFARQLPGTTEIEEVDDATGLTTKTKLPNRQTPFAIVLQKDPGGDPNKFSVLASYKDTKTGETTSRTFSAKEAYDAMAFLSGNERDVKPLAEMNTKYRLNEIGAKEPSYERFRDYYSQGAPQNQPQNTNTGKTYTFGGKNFTESAVRSVYEKKKNKGETFEQFIQRFNIK